MTCIAIIPARGGSKRIPRKNIKMFHGKPIIEYSIDVAQRCGIFDEVVVSTDDHEIATISRNAGAKVFIRKEDDGRRGTQEVAKEYLLRPECDGVEFVCVLYATAPMLRADALVDAHEILLDASNVGGILNYVVPVATWLRDPGQFYFGMADAFLEDVPLIDRFTVMLPIDPATECDINTPDDWYRAEQMYAQLKGTK